jgi:hypothetical protein
MEQGIDLNYSKRDHAMAPHCSDVVLHQPIQFKMNPQNDIGYKNLYARIYIGKKTKPHTTQPACGNRFHIHS